MALLWLVAAGAAAAQTLYKYRGPDGELVYSDRAPSDGDDVEVRALPAPRAAPAVTVAQRIDAGEVHLRARNDYYAPVELVLGFDELENVAPPAPDQPLRFVLAPQSETDLLQLGATGGLATVRYRYRWLVGDPASEHRPALPYRAPFAAASSHIISQAFPTAATHSTPDSRHAVDIAMPVGTDVYAARSGIVFEVVAGNYSGGNDPETDALTANLVRILHEDGTYAEYAHLNWNTIRVRPGDRVRRGDYIADSGNTGFSSGPHLHFAVIRNRGLGVESVPVVFAGPNGKEIAPRTGDALTAY